jgi:hypothetical protein
MTGDIFPQSTGAQGHLRLVPRRPWPRRLEVRFHVLDGRCPYGRGGPFRLAEDDLWKLIEIATRMESRA